MKNFNLFRQQSIVAIYLTVLVAFGFSSTASAAPTATVPATVEVELMTTKTAGGSGGPGIFNLWSNGYVENSFNFPATGAYDVRVAGYSTLASGVGAQAEIRVNGVAQAGRQIFSETSLASRTFRINVTAGIRRIAVAFLNDTTVGGDRNLLLDKVSIAAVVAAAPAPAPGSTALNVPASVEAEFMSVKSTGGADVANGVNLWNIWSNGYIENSFNFPSSGSYDITVVGFSTLADGMGLDKQRCVSMELHKVTKFFLKQV